MRSLRSSLHLRLALAALLPAAAFSATYYVDPAGNDGNNGSSSLPFRTVNHAAQIAQAGDIVEVRAGTYREWVRPKNSGTSAAPITYRAATGATVYLKGTELTGNGTSYAWTSIGGGLHQVALPDAFFASALVNPFAVALAREADGFRTLGEVYLNHAALQQVASASGMPASSWHASVSSGSTTLTANFNGADPNAVGNLVEVNARNQIFAPAAAEYFTLGHIIVDGFRLEGAANQFPYRFYSYNVSPPGIPQLGALSTGGGHHWEIANCKVRNAKNVGIDFGYLSEDLFRAFYAAQAGDKDAVTGGVFHAMIHRGLGSLGYHSIHHNQVAQCGAIGIAGMWGCSTTIQRNVIENNNRLEFGSNPDVGYEQGGIKTHFFDGGVVQDNLFRNNKFAALWMDKGYDGARVHGNVFVDNDLGVMLEVSAGSTLIDANIFIKSPVKHSHAAGAVLAQNLVVDCAPPTFEYIAKTQATLCNPCDANLNRTYGVIVPHVSDRRGTHGTVAFTRDNHYYNNLFLKRGLDFPPAGNPAGVFGNVAQRNFYAGVSAGEIEGSLNGSTGTNPAYSYTSNGSGVTLQFTLGSAPTISGSQLIGLAVVGFNPLNGWDIPDADRSFDWQTWGASPIAGPLTTLTSGANNLTLWPKTANPAITAGEVVNYRNDATHIGSETLRFSGGWVTQMIPDPIDATPATQSAAASQGHLGGNYRECATATGRIEVTFTGTRFHVIGARTAGTCNVQVLIDGTSIGTFDFGGSVAGPQPETCS